MICFKTAPSKGDSFPLQSVRMDFLSSGVAWASLNVDGKVPVAGVDRVSDCREMAEAKVWLGWHPVGPMAACKACRACSRMAARWAELEADSCVFLMYVTNKAEAPHP